MTTKIKIFVYQGCVESVWTNTDQNKTEIDVFDKDGDYAEQAEQEEASLERAFKATGEFSQSWP